MQQQQQVSQGSFSSKRLRSGVRPIRSSGIIAGVPFYFERFPLFLFPSLPYLFSNIVPRLLVEGETFQLSVPFSEVKKGFFERRSVNSRNGWMATAMVLLGVGLAGLRFMGLLF